MVVGSAPATTDAHNSPFTPVSPSLPPHPSLPRSLVPPVFPAAVVYLGDLFSLADGGGGGGGGGHVPAAIWTDLSNRFNGYVTPPETVSTVSEAGGEAVTTVVTTERLRQVLLFCCMLRPRPCCASVLYARSRPFYAPIQMPLCAPLRPLTAICADDGRDPGAAAEGRTAAGRRRIEPEGGLGFVGEPDAAGARPLVVSGRGAQSDPLTCAVQRGCHAAGGPPTPARSVYRLPANEHKRRAPSPTVHPRARGR